MLTVNRNPKPRDLHQFGWAMLVGFGVIGSLLWAVPRLRDGGADICSWSGTGAQIASVCLWGLGVGLFTLSLLAPGVAKPVYVVWMSVAVAIGTVASIVLLTLLFVFFLPVFSIVVRFGDPLRKKLKPSGSYWETYKPYEPTLERMKRPF